MIQIYSVDKMFLAVLFNPYFGTRSAINDCLFDTLEHVKAELTKPGFASRVVEESIVPWEGDLPFQNPIEYLHE